MKRCLTYAAAALLLLLPARAMAQSERLAGRLDDATRTAVVGLIQQARADGLPVDPLVNKALEGASKGADGARIVAAVRGLAERMGQARRAIGAASSEGELVAGAAALRAGVSPEFLARLRREAGGPPRMVAPLSLMADLVTRGVPADTAARAVVALARAGARDDELVAFRQSVERDIALGAPAGASTMLRVTAVGRELTNAEGAPTGAPSSGAVPPPTQRKP